jgi:hypothetical protein
MFENCPTPPLKKYINLKGLPKKIDTACTIFVFENRSYLCEFKTEFKKALACESRAQMFDEKNRRSKIS